VRKLRDGSVKYKASAYREYQRLAGNPFPIKIYPVDTKVKIYMGAGWSTAYVLISKQDSCTVRLAMGSRMLTVTDNRCIQPFEGK
jgi:hypothetical protein